MKLIYAFPQENQKSSENNLDGARYYNHHQYGSFVRPNFLILVNHFEKYFLRDADFAPLAHLLFALLLLLQELLFSGYISSV
jgi:hypothetical protein